MGFGDSGPPASSKQISYLLALVQKAGHASFGDARGPLGLTQKQSRGKFTAQEASELIDRLLQDPTASSFDAVEIVRTRKDEVAEQRRLAEQGRIVRGLAADILADELRLRGWAVFEPERVGEPGFKFDGRSDDRSRA
jgi:hypothetical protein